MISAPRHWSFNVRPARYSALFIPTLLLVALAYGALRWWQGPEVQGYVIQAVPLVQTVVGTGRVMTESRTQIGSEITAVVKERLVQEGDKVLRGDTLLVLRADDLAAQLRQAEAALAELATSRRPQAEVALRRAESLLAQAQRETTRRRDLADRALLSNEALEQAVQAEILARSAYDTARLRAAALAPGNAEEVLLQQRVAALKAQVAKTLVRAGVAGTVLTRNVEPGDLVQPGRVLFTIAREGGTEIRVPFDERNLSRLTLHQTAMVVTDAYPGQPFPARITFIAPSIDPQRGTVEVRLTVDPVPDFLRQDMTASVNVETGHRPRALAVPNDALDRVYNDQAQVLLLRNGKVHQQEVTLGLRGLAMTEIVAGLSAGDAVLADGTAPLADGTRVRFRERKAPVSRESGDTATRNELPVNFN
ncbi:efflux RND transporter periplasmic adaptor subunit [Marinobacter sp. X15-166B]|uniref:efflux RND transporter periplasmic adaptor subunit n=1 Tax=Marinobacter sp. X15-166B TaxID=1897620 RepID=UPI0018E91400|nr:efflux RND transporter periplasmic adaptor subunit [Marinobacter sp. X15-166B]